VAFPLKTLLVQSGVVSLIGCSMLLAEEGSNTITFAGMCDASAAAAVDGERFVVADDEDNVLRVYSRAGGEALSHFDLSEFLGNQGKKKPKEADLEAAAQIGGYTFWITSHGRNSKGKDKPERQRLFATNVRVKDGKVAITPFGQPYSSLLDDLFADSRLAGFELEEAAKLAPKAAGGLNIEGLAATTEGHLIIGFRNPVRAGKTLLVSLLNPVETVSGGKAKLGPPVQLELQGLGIRSIERVGGKYVIIAGATGEGNEPSRLFEWDGVGMPKMLTVTLSGLNPEGIAFHRQDGTGEYFVLSDDGGRQVEGQNCKDLKDPSLKRFRARLLEF
jgi:hypothetical protein